MLSDRWCDLLFKVEHAIDWFRCMIGVHRYGCGYVIREEPLWRRVKLIADLEICCRCSKVRRLQTWYQYKGEWLTWDELKKAHGLHGEKK